MASFKKRWAAGAIRNMDFIKDKKDGKETSY